MNAAASTPTAATGTSSSDTPTAVPELTIADEGVRIFLLAANEHRDAGAVLERMYSRRRNKDTTEAEALWTGFCAIRNEARDDIEGLRNRGGLLHLGAAQIDYSGGQYRVRQPAARGAA